MHDDYDFTAAQVQCAQNKGDVLACVHFQADGGDRHPSLDRIKNNTIKAKDLRLRFEFGGSAIATRLTPPTSLAQSASLDFKDFRLYLTVPYARWGNTDGVWQAGQDETTSWLDVVLYSGPVKEFHLSGLAEATVGFAVSFRGDSDAPSLPRATVTSGRLELDWEGLEISSPVRAISRSGPQVRQ